jgi:hypothetical protein
MNWIMLPILFIYMIVIYQLRQKVRQYLLMNIVRQSVLKVMGHFDNTEIVITIYNLVFAFVLLPIFFIGVSLLIGHSPYAYNWLYSFVAYGMSITAL